MFNYKLYTIIIQIRLTELSDQQIQFDMEYHNAYKKKGFIFKSMPQYTQMPNRAIITNVPDYQAVDNSIKTSKYNIFDFLPLNLMVQFSKLPNIYFLIIGIMQMIPQITNSGGFPVIFIPLSFVVGVSAIKDFFQDLKRKRSDEEINNSTAYRLGQNGFEYITWQKLRIGNIIKVHQNQQIPADIILLQSSQEKLNCFIQTKNLDGETNLKYKQVKYDIGKQLRPLCGQKATQLFDLRHQFQYERPNPFIYSFTGSYNGIPIDNNNIILRGCSLKITKWVTGVVIYTGVDSKIMMNSNKARQKKSRLQFKMGLIVIGVFLIQMIITFVAALIAAQSSLSLILQYKRLVSFTKDLFIQWGSWVLLFTNFVPISLIVTLEMVKYLQGMNISNCFFQTAAPSQVKVQTSTLNQQLGQIQHVFSDKTGTLTRNYMSFKYMVVGQNCYGYDSSRIEIPFNITNVDFHDQKFMRQVKGIKDEGSQIYDMLIALGMCHNVIIEEDENGLKKYNASSPDELAFINMARFCGWEYIGINENNQVCLDTSHGIIKYKLLHIIEFDSDRKRMTVILQKNQKILVYCKGADNIILQRIKNKNSPTCKLVAEKINQWSKHGLRTLLFAKREIGLKDYMRWAKMYASSLSKLQKIEKNTKTEKKAKLHRTMSKRAEEEGHRSLKGIEDFAKIIIEDSSLPSELLLETPEIAVHKLLNDNSLLTQNQKIFLQKYLDTSGEECNSSSKQIQQILQKQFELFGATAIEDQLQDNVKQTIQVIRKAGVKVWMLTGDKKQTAINIGLSCGLVEPDMAICSWQDTLQETIIQREKYGNRQCCLVATGEDLLKPLDQKLLLKLVNMCNAIICCRVTPKQKQDMVWLMRKNKCTTLAIGDGANDVNMINMAHVGIGIKGVEGAQAALCSDYAISEFQILRQLMLYHGRECYRKNSQLILFNFFKNLLLSLPQLWYGFINHFSSASIYDPWIYQLYNVVFTAFPIIAYAIFDQQHSVTQSLKQPQLYHIGLNNKLFNLSTVLSAFTKPVIYAFLLVFINFYTMHHTIDGTGFMFDLVSTGTNIFVQCVIIANLKILILSYKVSVGLIILILAGIVLFYVSSLLSVIVFPFGDSRAIILLLFQSVGSWSAMLVTVGAAIIYEAAAKRYNSLMQIEQQINVEFVETEIEMPLMKSKGSNPFE